MVFCCMLSAICMLKEEESEFVVVWADSADFTSGIFISVVWMLDQMVDGFFLLAS